MGTGRDQRNGVRIDIAGAADTVPGTPGRSTLVGAAEADDVAHVAPPRQVAESDHSAKPNMVLKVIVYGPTGVLLNIWAARGCWEGTLPQYFHGDKRAGGWAWDDASAKSVRVNAKIDGAGGLSVEAWAERWHGARVEIYAEPIDAVTVRKDAKLDTHVPGHALDDRHGPKESAHDGANKGTPGRGTPATAADAHDGADEGTPGTPATVVSDRAARAPEGTGNDHATTGDASGGPPLAGGGDAEIAEVAADDAESEDLANSLEQALGIDHGEQGDEEGSKGSGYRGGSADGRTGKGASTTGTGPGGPEGKDGGQEEASSSARGNDGTKFGDRDGVPLGSENGRYAGDGHEGDDGVRGAGGLFGGVIAVPEALKGAVELALLIEAGDVTGAAGELFSKGIGKGLSIAVARRIVAREARIAAAKEVRVIAKELARKKALAALAKAERDQALRVIYWETQRRYFRAYLKAAKAEQRAVRRALKKARPSQVAALEARRASAEAGEAVAKAEPVAGRLPQNHAYAGSEFPRSELPLKYREQGLRFKESGYPDFEPYAKTLPNGKKKLHIKYQGSRPADFAEANRIAGFEATPDGFRWHHDEANLGDMYLVPRDLHEAVKHSGGVAEYRHRTGSFDYDR
jgi:hypothetical protein